MLEQKNKKKKSYKHKSVITDIPKVANADLDKLNPLTDEFKRIRKTRLCSCCFEMATKMVSYDYNGFQLIEKYCDKHVVKYGPGPVSVSVSEHQVK
jgi:hypothetical protein